MLDTPQPDPSIPADPRATPAPQTATPPDEPRFVDQAGRSEVVPLLWPLDYAGRIWSEITVRRPTTKVVEAWARRIASVREAGGDPAEVPLPLYDAPDAVIQALDPDDDDRVGEVAKRFLPARFRGDPGS